MAKDNTIIYNSENFLKGIARSAYVGFQDMRNLDFSSNAGILKVRPSEAVTTGEPTDDEIVAMITRSSKTYLLTKDTREVYVAATDSSFSQLVGNDTSKGDGRGLAYWKDYLIALFVGGAQAHNGSIWVGGEFIEYTGTGDASAALVGQDNILYFAVGNNVSSLAEVDGQTFLPTDAGTYTFKEEALDLPRDERITSLAELGSWLLIGTDEGKVFLWDRVSTSFELPLTLNSTSSVSNMVTVGQFTYILTLEGTLYKTDGTSVSPVFVYPETIKETDDQPQSFISYGMAKRGNKVLFTMSPTLQTSSAAPEGIFEYDTDFKTTTIYNTPEQLGIATGDLRITSIAWSEFHQNLYYSFWNSGTSLYGVARFEDVNDQYKDDEAFFITDFRQVGTKLSPRTFKSIQVECSKEIDSETNDDSIKVYYRTTQNGDWVLIKTFDNTGDSSFYSPFGATTDKIQFKCVLNDDVELLELRIN